LNKKLADELVAAIAIVACYRNSKTTKYIVG